MDCIRFFWLPCYNEASLNLQAVVTFVVTAVAIDLDAQSMPSNGRLKILLKQMFPK